MTKPVAVYTDVEETDPEPGIALLKNAGFDVRVLETADPARVAAEATDATALLIGYSPVTQEVLDALPNLSLVATQSVGYDMINLGGCRERGIWVTNVPAAATEEVAGHALALSLALLRGLPFHDRAVRSGVWDCTTENERRLSATTLGVIGMGRIGTKLAELSQGLFERIVGCDPLPSAVANMPAHVEAMELEQLLAVADVVNLHLPLFPQTETERGTERLLNAETLALMQPGSIVVNVSRGALIDEPALIQALDSGQIAGAGLDVLTHEPPDRDHPLVRHPRTLITPHSAYRSATSIKQYVLDQALNATSWLRLGRPEYPVLPGTRSWS